MSVAAVAAWPCAPAPSGPSACADEPARDVPGRHTDAERARANASDASRARGRRRARHAGLEHGGAGKAPARLQSSAARRLSGRELEHLRPDRSRRARRRHRGRFLPDRPGATVGGGRRPARARATTANGSPRRLRSASSWRRSPPATAAATTRLSDTIAHGNSDDLPRVSFWELWNEPNFGEDLAPQAIKGSTVPASGPAYRSLLDAGWRGLGLTGHGRDTILIGNLDARGVERESRVPGQPQGLPGNFGADQAAAVRPNAVLRELDVQGAPRRRGGRRRVPNYRRRIATVPERPPGSVPSIRIRRPPVPGQPAADQGQLERSRLHRVLGAAAARQHRSTGSSESTALARAFRSTTTSTATSRTRRTTARATSSRRPPRRPTSTGRNTCPGATRESPRRCSTCCTTRIRRRTCRSSAGSPAV